MKRKALLGLGAAAALLLSGCALNSGDSSNDSASASGPVTLTFQSLAYQDSTVASPATSWASPARATSRTSAST